MVKLRLWGTPEEIKALAEFIESCPRLRVLSRSEGYPDRGKSVYERVYIDVELKPGVNEEDKNGYGNKDGSN